MKHNLYKCQLLLLLLLLLLLSPNCFVSQRIVVRHETLSCFRKNCFVTEKFGFVSGNIVLHRKVCFVFDIILPRVLPPP